MLEELTVFILSHFDWFINLSQWNQQPGELIINENIVSGVEGQGREERVGLAVERTRKDCFP